MNIFVGNLLFEATENDVRKLFEGFGAVTSVAIVMEKKGVKSRGFGFVEMADDTEALAAIAALDGKPFMDRPLNVSQAHSKPEGLPPKKATTERGGRFTHGYVKTGSAYKQGRRSRNFIARKQAEGADVNFSKPVRQENPMRWRKNPSQSKPWAKKYGEGPRSARTEAGNQARPWQRSGNVEPKPWKRAESGESRTWRKPVGESKPWQRSASSESRPWKRQESGEPRTWNRPAGPQSKPWQRGSSSESRPWKRAESGESRPWRKSAGQVKPWQRSSTAESKPWKRAESGESRTWRKPAEAKPWKSSGIDSKPPRRRSQSSSAKPWQKRSSSASKPAVRARKRPSSVDKE